MLVICSVLYIHFTSNMSGHSAISVDNSKLEHGISQICAVLCSVVIGIVVYGIIASTCCIYLKSSKTWVEFVQYFCALLCSESC